MLPAGTAGLGGQTTARALPPKHERHRPETTLLYQIADRHYSDFLAQLTVQGRSLSDYAQQEFTDFLKCGLLERGFLRVRCESESIP